MVGFFNRADTRPGFSVDGSFPVVDKISHMTASFGAADQRFVSAAALVVGPPGSAVFAYWQSCSFRISSTVTYWKWKSKVFTKYRRRIDPI